MSATTSAEAPSAEAATTFGRGHLLALPKSATTSAEATSLALPKSAITSAEATSLRLRLALGGGWDGLAVGAGRGGW